MNQSIFDEIKNLKKKAEQNRQMHFSISRRTKNWEKLLHALTLVGSSALAVLTFADYKTFLPWFPHLSEGQYKLTIGFFASFIFILTILKEYFRLSEKSASHESIGRQLTSFIRVASAAELNEELTQEDLDRLTSDYNTIHENAPVIPDKVFLKEKQKLKIKVSISKQLESNPHISIWFYRVKMKLSHFNNKQKDGAKNHESKEQ